eukprot:150099-Rhodomonas_salina.2
MPIHRPHLLLSKVEFAIQAELESLMLKPPPLSAAELPRMATSLRCSVLREPNAPPPCIPAVHSEKFDEATIAALFCIATAPPVALRLLGSRRVRRPGMP